MTPAHVTHQQHRVNASLATLFAADHPGLAWDHDRRRWSLDGRPVLRCSVTLMAQRWLGDPSCPAMAEALERAAQVLASSGARAVSGHPAPKNLSDISTENEL